MKINLPEISTHLPVRLKDAGEDLAVLLKYLLVVAVSLMLAFIIAQDDAAAQAAPAAAAAPAATAAPAKNTAAAAYGDAGSFSLKVVEASWRDGNRNREVPVFIYSPELPPGKSADTAFPVILFSHGLGGNRAGGKLWAEHWAGHGYVVVAMQHIGSDESLWKDQPVSARIRKMKAGMSLSNLGLRTGDVRFVIDEIVRRTKEKEPSFAAADPTRIGMSGHSFGAQTTLAVSGQKAGSIAGQAGLEPRIMAAIAFSPNARNKQNLARQFGDIQIPFFSITGTLDGSILDDDTRYEHRMLPYENMPAGGKFLVVFEGGDHMVFGGHQLEPRRTATARDKAIQSAVKASTLAFWDATLKSDASAKRWLDGTAGPGKVGFKSTLAPNDVFSFK